MGTTRKTVKSAHKLSLEARVARLERLLAHGDPTLAAAELQKD
ncbi:MAG: hypothetical protein JWR80_9478 [Bradyrhizobium sp.]|nr:hypothetical protein [Bradyrhizobium sp.]